MLCQGKVGGSLAQWIGLSIPYQVLSLRFLNMDSEAMLVKFTTAHAAVDFFFLCEFSGLSKLVVSFNLSVHLLSPCLLFLHLYGVPIIML